MVTLWIEKRRTGLTQGAIVGGVLLKEVHVVQIRHHAHGIAHARLAARIDPGDVRMPTRQQLQEHLVAHQLGHFHLGVDHDSTASAMRAVGRSKLA